MFRVLFLAATAAALAGCGSESTTRAKFRADDAKCKSYGAERPMLSELRSRSPAPCVSFAAAGDAWAERRIIRQNENPARAPPRQAS